MNTSKEAILKEHLKRDPELKNYSFENIMGTEGSFNSWAKVALAAMEEYASSFKEQDTRPKWKSVKEHGYPEHNLGVLVFIPDEDFHITSGMWDVSNKWVLLDEYRKPDCEVTHYMDLPEIPKEYQKEEQENNEIMMFLKKHLPKPAEPLQKKEQDTDKDREKLLSKLKDAKQRLTADFYQNWSHVQIAIDAAIKYIKNQGTGTDTDVEKLAEEAITNFPYKGSLELFAKEAFIAGYNAAKQTK
jgi:hypothetical protein